MSPSPSVDNWDLVSLYSDNTLFLLVTHGPDRCRGPFCCIHNPSDHHMVTWPQNWRRDRELMERLCPHGVGHPDPDDLSQDTTHGCDGCCET